MINGRYWIYSVIYGIANRNVFRNVSNFTLLYLISLSIVSGDWPLARDEVRLLLVVNMHHFQVFVSSVDKHLSTERLRN